MAKISGLFVIVAGTASLGTAYVIHSNTTSNHNNDHQLESKQSDIANDPGSGTDAALVTPETGDRAVPVVVTIPRRITTPGNTSMVAARSASPVLGDHASLVRELQRELRRVGCYDGPLNESWTLGTRAAMKTFTNRINAILPIDKPDQVLLTLVQGYRDRVCDAACPPGEGLAKDGRCLSNAILARATKTAPQNNSTLAGAEQPRDLVASVSSTVTPADPGIGDLANGPTARADPSAEHVAAAARTARGREMAVHRASRRRSTFAGGFFGLFGW
jgi:hypothetical protein